MVGMIELWHRGLREKWIQPLALAAALNLDFLCIHPFRDGNGRVSRLLFLLACYHCGIEAGRYISLERIIEENKERYYEVLEQSSQRWHEGKHDPWPAMNFLLFILTQACKEFEQRVGQIKNIPGEKTALVVTAIQSQTGSFAVADLQNACPGVSVDMIRHVLKQLRAEKKVHCLGRGRTSRWGKTGN
jgi:Fic family protein